MSQINPSRTAKLVISFFLREKGIINLLLQDLSKYFGSIDMISRWIPFDQTSYYEKEMYSPLYRRLIVYKNLIEQFDLAKIKLITSQLEEKYSKSGRRLVNIDPGYILPERYVLATGKNYAHRICIGLGIYAELTFIYKAGTFKALPWTYPDHKLNCLKNFLVLVRDKFVADLKQSKSC